MLSNFLHSVFGQLIPVGQMTGTAAMIWAIGTFMTLVWSIGLNQKSRQVTGVLGGPAIALGTLMMGISIVFGVSSMLVQMLVGLLTSSLASIPLIGGFLSHVVSNLVSSVATLVLCIGIGLYVLRNAERLGGAFFYTIARPFQRGYNKFHLLAGALGLGLVINHPSISAANYFIPTILTVLLGFYTLGVVRPKWSEIKWNTEKRYVAEFGELPNGRKAENEEDARLLREAMVDVEKLLSGEALAEEIEKKCGVRKRIAEQLDLFEAAKQQASRVEDEAVAAKLNRLQAELDAEAEAEAEREAEEAQQKHLH